MADLADGPAVNVWRFAERDVAIVKAILNTWGYPPDGYVYDLIWTFMAERIGRQCKDYTDRDLVQSP